MKKIEKVIKPVIALAAIIVFIGGCSKQEFPEPGHNEYFYKTLGDGFDDILSSVAMTEDPGAFIIAGQKLDSENNSYLFLCSIDDQGMTQWSLDSLPISQWSDWDSVKTHDVIYDKSNKTGFVVFSNKKKNATEAWLLKIYQDSVSSTPIAFTPVDHEIKSIKLAYANNSRLNVIVQDTVLNGDIVYNYELDGQNSGNSFTLKQTVQLEKKAEGKAFIKLINDQLYIAANVFGDDGINTNIMFLVGDDGSKIIGEDEQQNKCSDLVYGSGQIYIPHTKKISNAKYKLGLITIDPTDANLNYTDTTFELSSEETQKELKNLNSASLLFDKYGNYVLNGSVSLDNDNFIFFKKFSRDGNLITNNYFGSDLSGNKGGRMFYDKTTSSYFMFGELPLEQNKRKNIVVFKLDENGKWIN